MCQTQALVSPIPQLSTTAVVPVLSLALVARDGGDVFARPKRGTLCRIGAGTRTGREQL